MFHVKHGDVKGRFESCEDLLRNGCRMLGIEPTDDQVRVLLEFGAFMVAENERFNLTSITKPEDVVIKHLVDSLGGLLVRELREAGSAVDLGSGNGTPGIPLAIVLPNVRFSLLEANRKRSAYLNECIVRFSLRNVEVVTGRAEELARSDLRSAVDVVVARAFGPLRVVLEVGLPCLRLHGTLVAYKSAEIKDELEQSHLACRMLHGALSELREYRLPVADLTRSLVLFRKTGRTPEKYPRSWSTIKRSL